MPDSKGKQSEKSSGKKESATSKAEGRKTRSTTAAETAPSTSTGKAGLSSVLKRKQPPDLSHLAPPSPIKVTKPSVSSIGWSFKALEAKQAEQKKKQLEREKLFARHERARERAEGKGKSLPTLSDYSDDSTDDDSVSDPHFPSPQDVDEPDTDEDEQTDDNDKKSGSGSGSQDKPETA